MAIVALNELDRDTVVARFAELEAELFGAGAWNAHMVREELDAPARTYLFAVEDAAERDPSTPALRASAQDDRKDDVSCRPESHTVSCHPENHTVSCHPERSEGSHPVIRGYAGYWYDGDDAELMTIGVAKDAQRQGIASALLDALIARARAQGARRMLLEVRVDNDPALALYQLFGFERMGLRKRYYQPGNIDAYTMSLDLDPAEPRVVGFQPSQPVSQQQGEQA